jgi:hypothetical protein
MWVDYQILIMRSTKCAAFQFITYLFFLTLFFCPHKSQARPEYAVRMAANRCTMCHVSPGGGGLRNLTGKAFGSRGFTPGPYSSQDLITVDARALYYLPENTSPAARSGMAWMAGIVGGNIPLTSPDDPKELRLVFAHNIGGIIAGGREFYMRWQRHGDDSESSTPQHILIGRFHAPFGILSEEHRTYTRIQTQTTWNQFEMGAMASGQMREVWHYDLAAVNGENTAGTALTPDQALTWGGVANLRYTPMTLPFILGISASHHNRVAGQESANAGVLYGLLSLERMTDSRFPGTFIFEYARAKEMNANLEVGFIDTSTTYDETIANSQSEGLLAQFNYELNDLSTLILRYDQLLLDVRYPSDAFRRYGVGIRKYVHANTLLSARYDFSEAGHPSQRNTTAKSSVDAFYLVLQIGI